MTRGAFAQVTGLGEATLSRWEKGILVQNRANDRYLRLLNTPWAIKKLQDILAPKPVREKVTTISSHKQFRELSVSDEVRRRQAGFQLRLAS